MVLLHAWRGNALTPRDKSVLSLRVLPTDFNLQGQMHSSRYLSVMELGCADLIARMGLLKLMWRQKWTARIIAVNMRYFRPLKIFQHYELVTYLLCWDNQWLYLEQRFFCNKKIVAIGQVKVMIWGHHHSIAPGYFLELLGHDSLSPLMPTAIRHWSKVT
jgi:acyl-CoA thioesterase FadM